MGIALPRSGISFAPSLGWELARQWHHISPAEWDAMDGDQQAKYIAVHQLHFQMDGVIAKQQADEAKRKRPKYGR